MTAGEPRIYVSAGEPSGDLHAAPVVRALRKHFPAASIDGTGGPAMALAGARLVHSIDQCAALGTVEVLRSIPRHLRLLGDLRKRFRDRAYDLVIVLDYPGFHLKVAEAAASSGIPVLYYIAPQLWAWGARRAALLKQWTRELAVILPFEERFFQRLDVRARFVGHPLLDQPPLPSRVTAARRLGLDPDHPTLALLPGSRPQEVARLWPVFRDAARAVSRAIAGLQVVVSRLPAIQYPGDPFTTHTESAADALAVADASICKSGTVTLQSALAGVPMVVAYRVHPVSYAVARRVVRTRRIGLVNLVADRDVVPELIQRAAAPAALATAVLPLLDPAGKDAAAQRSAFAEIRERLGTPGAGERVARMAAELVA